MNPVRTIVLAALLAVVVIKYASGFTALMLVGFVVAYHALAYYGKRHIEKQQRDIHQFNAAWEHILRAAAEKARTEMAREQGGYAALGLKPGATEDQIKKAYRRLAFKVHPDTVAGKADPGAFQKLTEAKDACLAHSKQTTPTQ